MAGQSKFHHASALETVGIRWEVDFQREYPKVFDLGDAFVKRW